MAGAGAALADIFEVAYRDGNAADALNEMVVRADVIGAGPILDRFAQRRVRMTPRRRRWQQTWARRHRAQ